MVTEAWPPPAGSTAVSTGVVWLARGLQMGHTLQGASQLWRIHPFTRNYRAKDAHFPYGLKYEEELPLQG